MDKKMMEVMAYENSMESEYNYEEVLAHLEDVRYFSQQLSSKEKAAKFLLDSMHGKSSSFLEANYLLMNHIKFNFNIKLDGSIEYIGIDEINPLHLLEVLEAFEVTDETIKGYEYCNEIMICLKAQTTNEKDTNHRFFIDRYIAGEPEYIIDGETDKRIQNYAIKAFLELIKTGCSS